MTAQTPTSLGDQAIEYARNNWQVGPLCQIDGAGTIVSPHGKVPNGRLVPHGVLDFTSDVATVTRWWSRREWNIGVRPPETMFVLDVDCMDTLNALVAEHGPLPETLTTISGRAKGGRHYWFWHPGGQIASKIIKGAIETKTHSGYLVMPPSIHPDTGNRYQRIDAPVATAPRWLIDLIRPRTRAPRSIPRSSGLLSGSSTWTGSPAEDFNASHTWAEVLMPHGWVCLDGDTEADRARWVHPKATSNWSATVRYGLLFVYSTSTEFGVTEGNGVTKGYTKFRAYALLNFPGLNESDRMSAAARSLNSARSLL
jgi:hypothetical protein